MQSQKRRDLWLLHPNNGRSFTIERSTETANEKKMKGNEIGKGIRKKHAEKHAEKGWYQQVKEQNSSQCYYDWLMSYWIYNLLFFPLDMSR